MSGTLPPSSCLIWRIASSTYPSASRGWKRRTRARSASDRSGDSIEVEPGNSSADYLQGFLRGTRKALYDSGRKSITISIPEVTPFQLGALIGLFERAVSFYASLVNINAYHQPGVEAGKKAAANFLELLGAVRSRLVSEAKTAEQVAFEVDADPEDVYHCLTHLSANGEVQISIGATPKEDNFSL